MRISRAWHIRPNVIRSWDYWEEYIPAADQLTKIPIVDEVLFAVFKGKSSESSFPEIRLPQQNTTKTERLAIFNDLKKEAETRKNGKQN